MLGTTIATIDGYRVQRALGTQPLGSRYEVLHPERGPALLYVLEGAPPLPAASGRRLCGLRHRNLGRVLHVGQVGPGADGPPYLIEEHVAGEILRDRLLRTGPMQVREALWALGQVVAGLSALHQAGFAHRNLSLAAVVVISDGDDELLKLTEILAVAEVPERDLADDLQRLGGLFLKLLGVGLSGYTGPPSAPAALLHELRRLTESTARKSATELYASIEAAVRRADHDGGPAPHPPAPGPDASALAFEDSTTVSVLKGPPPQGVQVHVTAQAGAKDSATVAISRLDLPEADDPATVEMERLDPSELLSLFPAGTATPASLAQVLGPLERAPAAPAHAPHKPDGAPRLPSSRPALVLIPGAAGQAATPGPVITTSPTAATRPRQTSTQPSASPGGALGLWQSLRAGPLSWLLPLGMLTAAILGLAGWVLWRGPHR